VIVSLSTSLMRTLSTAISQDKLGSTILELGAGQAGLAGIALAMTHLDKIVVVSDGNPTVVESTIFKFG
jgi:hypothetical protein